MISIPENGKRRIVVWSVSETRVSSKAKRGHFSLKANGAVSDVCLYF